MPTGAAPAVPVLRALLPSSGNQSKREGSELIILTQPQLWDSGPKNGDPAGCSQQMSFVADGESSSPETLHRRAKGVIIREKFKSAGSFLMCTYEHT